MNHHTECPPAMNPMDNKNFFTNLLVKNCPCRNSPASKDIKNLYRDSKSLEEFVTQLEKSGWWGDKIELRDNVLYTTKYPWSNYGKHNHKGRYSESCHCGLGSHAEEPVSDIFCHCCTVGYYGNIFKKVFGIDVKVEFIDSIIIGGTECKAAIYLPDKSTNS